MAEVLMKQLIGERNVSWQSKEKITVGGEIEK